MSPNRLPAFGDATGKPPERSHGRDDIERHARIGGQDFVLRSREVVRALSALDPEPIDRHFVVIDNRRFPPKQVISAVTGLDRADFTTHQARRTLMRLGFPAGRREHASASPGSRGSLDAGARRSGSPPGRETAADRLRPHVGQWVAIKDDEVIYSAATPQRVVAWLTGHGQKADSMFRVPDNELSSTGLAAL